MSLRPKDEGKAKANPQVQINAMTKAEQELLDYLQYQFPSTKGNERLVELIHAVYEQGLSHAADICFEERPSSVKLRQRILLRGRF